MKSTTEERLQKVLARAGVASRRKAEELITAGRVEVNGKVARELGTKVNAKKDLIRVDGKLIELAAASVYFVLYKPAGVVTTLADPEGRPSVGALIQNIEERVYPVGRLDYDAEGALLLTNDGDLAHKLTHPSFGARRTYLAKVRGRPTEQTLVKMRTGVELEDGIAKPIEVKIHSHAEVNTWVRIVVDEGRPHLIKRLCEAVEHPVQRLFRPDYAGISAEGMEPGSYRELTREDVRLLKGGGADSAGRVGLPARRHGRGPGGSAASLGRRGRSQKQVVLEDVEGESGAGPRAAPSAPSARPGGFKGKPVGKPGGKPGGRPGGKPGGRPGGRPQGRQERSERSGRSEQRGPPRGRGGPGGRGGGRGRGRG